MRPSAERGGRYDAQITNASGSVAKIIRSDRILALSSLRGGRRGAAYLLPAPIPSQESIHGSG
jgi:hypothetical protein